MSNQLVQLPGALQPGPGVQRSLSFDTTVIVQLPRSVPEDSMKISAAWARVECTIRFHGETRNAKAWPLESSTLSEEVGFFRSRNQSYSFIVGHRES